MMRSLIASCLLLPSLLAAADSADVIIYGGSSGGITAAIQTARMGKKAILIEPTQFLGGLTTGGLGATDIGNKKAIGGMSREFYGNIFKYYSDEGKWKHEKREAYFARKPHGNTGSEDTMWTFEPHVASAIYEAMLKPVEGSVTIVKGERLDLKKGVVKEGAKITKILMESGREFSGPMFIDATYEGDLMAKAGVKYHVGREANSVYGEKLNGVQVGHSHSHQFIVKVDPYVKKGDPSSGLLPGIEKDPGVEFSGDRKVQAYNFRMCTTDVAENRQDWEKPANYDEQWFELALRNVEAGDHRISWAPGWMPNRKTDTNNKHAISTDFIGQNWDYPEADYETRAKIWKAHEDWQKGLMWTYAHHPRVPEAIRKEFQKLGLAKDEFPDNGHFPRQLYVREARRMIGDYVMTEKNCKREEIVQDSVGMGAYNMDSHNIQRYVTKDGYVRNEGDVQVRSRPYPISYRSIRPKAEECTNLLVPVCLSASHIAYGSIRMEPVFMVLGQSAATAAVHAIEQGTTIQGIDYEKLKARLEQDGQMLDFETPALPEGFAYPKASLPGIVVDDAEAELTGFDNKGFTSPGFVEQGYRHDNGQDKGPQRARFTADLPKAGRYQISVSYNTNHNRSSAVPVTIHHAEGETVVMVDQKKAPAGPNHFQPLGSFSFEAGKGGWVEISNAGTTGFVMVDAVQWLPVK
ncbi:FAD dependent oxidoreductase [Prosthecobacter fusiformis]|uniref:FAD dependent oxidoreductase n=1 Tax=Prosthecobacter fusiformis TaxID=48464 RepID=A0A4V3FE11_9BACT|nr:FAD-dependent oxidoreductase [Prosthecobacter fusiformis]TDU64140.1 FAD dependent oxidoreductase [Prosthecobacter fusiformis]